MGAGIAQVAATAGHRVSLVDSIPEAAAAAVDRLAGNLERLVTKGRLAADEADAVRGRLQPAGSAHDLPECGLVIEAVPEDLALQRKVFADLGASQPATTILATNTSSIDISAIAEAVIHPERVIGLRFFNPLPVMALVEVVRCGRAARSSPLPST